MAYYNCLLFDADGTLLDFQQSQRKALMRAFEVHNLAFSEEIAEAYNEINMSLWSASERGEIRRDKIFRERFKKLSQRLGISFDTDALNRSYEQALADQADLMPDALEVLRELSEVATLAVITNGTARVQRSRFELSGIEKYMDGLYISEVVGANKPSRRIFDMAIEGLGIENTQKVLVIGDSLKADIEGGHNAGLATCFIGSELQEQKNTVKPDFVISDLKQLYEIVMEPEELAEIGNEHRKHQMDG